MNHISAIANQNGSLLGEFLVAEDVDPVLVDIGSAGKRHQIWDVIAGFSTLVAFDPDSRQAPVTLSDMYKRVVMVDKAVCADDEQTEVEFILTQYPSCSSTLTPNAAEVSGYSFADYFTPVDKVRVPATSLNRVAQEYGLDKIDWIKIDSQGTDLRILRSISPEIFCGVNAIDVEPGWVNAYLGEDLFSQVHEFLIQRGFWLSDLRCQHYPRVTSPSLNHLRCELPNLTEQQILKAIKGCPTAAEARYLRRIESVGTGDRRQMILLFAFAMLDGHYGFGFDIAAEFERSLGDASVAKTMRVIASQVLSLQHPSGSAIPKAAVTGQLARRVLAVLGPGLRRRVRSLFRNLRT